MYRLIRPLLFLLPPEVAHHVSLAALRVFYRLGLLHLCLPRLPDQHCDVFGLSFRNRVGVAAGLDKNGDYIDCLSALGIGFIELGAVTPQAQSGNVRPRLFRLPAAQGLINRMGFNNNGIDYLVNNLKNRRSSCIVGVNMGKNKATPLSHAADDYCACLEKIYPYADFATINISSPNTPGLRELQGEDYLRQLLQQVKTLRDKLQQSRPKTFPLLLKIAPDLTQVELNSMVQTVTDVGIDGIIATNTTASRDAIRGLTHADETGGLSGQPLAEKSQQLLGWLADCKVPVIAVGGIGSAQEAKLRIQQGASLVQLYTALIYQGPGLLRRIICNLSGAK